MERLKKIQKDHHYIVDWHIPKKAKEDTQDTKKPEKDKVVIDYGDSTKKD